MEINRQINKVIIFFSIFTILIGFIGCIPAEAETVIPVYQKEHYSSFEEWHQDIVKIREEVDGLRQQESNLKYYISDKDIDTIDEDLNKMSKITSVKQGKKLENEVNDILADAATESKKPQNIVVQTAYSLLGTPYVWGGENPKYGLDCSGLTKYCYAQVGIDLVHYTGTQYSQGMYISYEDLQPGDLIFFGSNLHHVGIYIGNGQFIHAPQTGDVVKISNLSDRSDYCCAARYV